MGVTGKEKKKQEGVDSRGIGRNLASTEEIKISRLKKMTKSLRDQANKGYRENKANKKEQ